MTEEMDMAEENERNEEVMEEEVSTPEDEVPSDEVVEEAADIAEEIAEDTEELEEQIAALEEELEKAKAEASEYLDGWQRAQAEFSNYKKRQEAERAQMMRLANATLLRKLLPVLDDFKRALDNMPSGLDQLTWIEGIVLIRHKLEGILDSEGVEPIETDGEMFNPRYHEAVTHEEAPGYEEGEIIGEVQKGYMIGDRVLRPALVRVAKAPEEAGPGDDENDNSDK